MSELKLSKTKNVHNKIVQNKLSKTPRLKIFTTFIIIIFKKKINNYFVIVVVRCEKCIYNIDYNI